MMVVVVNVSNSLWIKGISLQPPYNQGTHLSIMDSHPHGCTQVVSKPKALTYKALTLQLGYNHEDVSP